MRQIWLLIRLLLLFCLSKKKKLEAIIIKIDFTETGDNTAIRGNARSNNADDNAGDNARNKDAIKEDNGDNIIKAGKKTADSGSTTIKDAVAKNAAAGMDDNARNIERE